MECSMLATVLLLALAYSTLVSASKLPPLANIIVCSNSTKLEPSISEILQSILPNELSESQVTILKQIYSAVGATDASFQSTSKSVWHEFLTRTRDVGALVVPFQRFISDGTFNIDMTTDFFFFRDVLLVQQNYYTINTVCSVIPKSYTSLRNIFCKCFTGDNLWSPETNPISQKFNPFTTEDTVSSSGSDSGSYTWCVRNPCTEKSSKDGFCLVTVDPFRRSCILIPLSNISDENENESDDEDEDGNDVDVDDDDNDAGNNISVNYDEYDNKVDNDIDNHDDNIHEKITKNIKIRTNRDHDYTTDNHHKKKKNLVKKSEDEISSRVLHIIKNVENLISYNLTMPLIQKNYHGLDIIIDQFNQEKEKANKKIKKKIKEFKIEEIIDEYLLIFLISVQELLHLKIFLGVPKYLFNFIIGTILVKYCDDVASSSFFRYSTALFFGMFLSIVWIFFFVQRSLEQITMLANSMPHILGPLSFLSISYFIPLISVKENIIRLFFEFWFGGAFNISWLGKFYFLISAIISLLLTYFTNFLSSECMTYYLLKLVLISIGCYYLESSTSSVELSIFLIIFFTNEHHISHLFWKVYIYFAASHPTVKYSGRKITHHEYNEEGINYTEKALKSLQMHINGNPHIIKKHTQHPENMSNGTSVLFNRFCQGDYIGKPELEVIREKEEIIREKEEIHKNNI